jgi:ankyrin repeat protein
MTSFLLAAGADPSKDSSLSLAVKAGDVGLISTLLSGGPAINKITKIFPTALYQAVVAENLQLVQLLLAHGADPNFELKNKK